MQGIIYNPEDAGFIASALELCEHIPECDECREAIFSTAKGLAALSGMFKELNRIAMIDIANGDFYTARHFCERWLQIHEVLQLVEGVEGVQHGTVQ